MTQNYSFNVLLETIPQWAQRNDATFLANVPRFIVLAENRLATDMKQQGFISVVTGQFEPGVAMAKPAFWRETISFSYTLNGETRQIFLRNLEYLKAYWPSQGDASEPQYYADYNFSNFYLAPSPADSYPFELVYYARLDPLSEENQQNWLTLNAPQALFYACMLEASIFQGNDKNIAKYQNEYNGAVAGLKNENRERLLDRNSGVAPR